MALICNRHPFEYAENVCSSCGIAFCHDCLVYPRGTKKPPLCVPCAISAAGVRSSARNNSNLSRREVKKRVRDAKGLQQPQPYVEAPAAPSDDRDFELTSSASFDQGWAVSWDEGRDPHPGYPEPVHVTWGHDPFAGREPGTADPAAPPSPAAATPAPVAAAAAPPAAPKPAPAPAAAPKPAAAAPEPPATTPPRPPELPRLQTVVAERPPSRPQPPADAPGSELPRGHAPIRPGGLPSVRPPLKPAADAARPPLSPLNAPGPATKSKLSGANPPLPAQQPGAFGGLPARPDTPPSAAAPPAPAAAPSGRLRRKENEPAEGAEMLGWLDDLLESKKGQPDRG